MGQSPDSNSTYLKYSPVTGYFEQDEPGTDPRGYDFVSPMTNGPEMDPDSVQVSHSFGLIEREYDTDAIFDPNHERTQWQRFHFHIDELNAHTAPGVQFKVLYRLSPPFILLRSMLTIISRPPRRGLSQRSRSIIRH
jgi:hypothetical protein